MKMKACSRMIRMWKMPHAVLASTPGRKVTQLVIRPAMSMKTSSPPYMLPNSRMASEIGFTSHSMTFITRLTGASRIAPKPCAWNGAVSSSLPKPMPPLADQAWPIRMKKTETDRPSVVLRSAVGTERKKVWWAASSPPTSLISVPGRSSGSRSMVFMNTTHMKMVSASGVTERRSPWKVSRTWPSTNSTISSTNAWPLLGTPGVALRAARPNHSTNSRPSVRATAQESKLNWPPSARPELWVRWCWMYSVKPPALLDSLTKRHLSSDRIGQDQGQRGCNDASQQGNTGKAEHCQCDHYRDQHQQPLQRHPHQQPRKCGPRGADPTTQRHHRGDPGGQGDRTATDQCGQRPGQSLGEEGQRHQHGGDGLPGYRALCQPPSCGD